MRCLITIIFIFLFPFCALAYSPPIGIPDPGITWGGGLHPIDTPVPTQPSGWPDSEVANHYYIDKSSPNCTDDNNQWGYPDKPRCHWIGGFYPAGTYVEFHGEVNDTFQTTFTCTEDNPCWIIGRDSDRPIFTGENTTEYPGNGRIILSDSTYVFVDGLEFSHKTGGGINIDNNGPNSSDHIALRNLYAHDFDFFGPGSIFSALSRYNGTIHDVVMHNVTCENIAYPFADGVGDPDLHCSVIGLHDAADIGNLMYNMWWVDNHVEHAAGSGIQVNGWNFGQDRVHNIYIGRITGSDTRQRLIGIKESSNVVVSQNNYTVYGEPDLGNLSEIFGWAESPHGVWFLFNTVHLANDGFRTSQPDEPPYSSATTKAYLIGNKIYDIDYSQELEDAYPYNPANEWRYGQGIHLQNGNAEVWMANNTMYNVRGGLLVHQADNPTHFFGNIVDGIHAGDTFTAYQNNALLSSHEADYNIFYDADGDTNWRWNSTDYNNLTDWRNATVLDLHSANSDPLFADTTAKDFHLSAGSPAIDSDDSSKDIYGVFYNTFGLDIRRDFDGNYRPQGSSWDVGAFESPHIVGPVVHDGRPIGKQPVGTTSVTMSVTTDANATCRYSTSAGVAYTDMTYTFDTTGGTLHTQAIGGLTDGQSYIYYVKCTDGSTDNDVDYKVWFSVDPVDAVSPTIVDARPSGLIDDSDWHDNERIHIITSENTTCRYSLTQNQDFVDMTSFVETGKQSHASDNIPQTHGASYTYYVKCQDAADNISTEYTVSWQQPGGSPTCSDDIQNGDETGVDCGGSCPPCATFISCGSSPMIH